MLNTDPTHPDTDSDSLSDGYEVQLQLNPLQSDSDSDGLADDHELLICQPPTNALSADTDQDSLTDFEEINAQWVFPRFSEPVSPVMADTDGDGVADGLEVTAFFTDSDAGGLPDNIEALYGLNIAEPADDGGDLDGDGQTNIQEYQAGSSLNGDFAANFDWDQDGMPTVWETAQGLDPLNYQDAGNDPDGDWSANLSEYENGTQPQADDSGESGYTPSGQPLASDGSSESWDEDWDNDGESNLEELLENESDPTIPGCTCGGDACGCSESGNCSSPCNNTASCTCGGSNCTCSYAGQCGGAGSCSPDSGCYCGGNACSCADNTGCAQACMTHDGCTCGGQACTCAYAGCCTSTCEPPNACSCGGESCGCSDGYGCSSTCTSTNFCSCGASGCTCSDASGCTSGSCYTPPPCNCSYVGNGCTCATSTQCSGDCYTYACECSPNDPEDCECSYSGQCSSQCENTDGPCQCGCIDICYTDSDCNNDCELCCDKPNCPGLSGGCNCAGDDTQTQCNNTITLTINGPDKIGIVGGVISASTYIAEAPDGTSAEDITFTITAGQSKVKLGPISVDATTAQVELEGIEHSEKDEVTLKASSGGLEGTKTITVVKPAKWKTPLPGVNGEVVPRRMTMTEYTSPSRVPSAADRTAGKWGRDSVIFAQIMRMNVLDQNGDSLGNVYDGANIEEIFGGVAYSINQTLKSDEDGAFYSDPVGSGAEAANGENRVKLPYPDRTWIEAATPPALDDPQAFLNKPSSKDVSVEAVINGHKMPYLARDLKLIPPRTVEVSYPF